MHAAAYSAQSPNVARIAASDGFVWREAFGAEGQVVPQQWLARTTARGVRPDDLQRLDLVMYEITPNGGALCCDATLVSPLTRTGHPQPCAVTLMALCCKLPSAASRRRILSTRRADRSDCLHWGRRLAASEARVLFTSSATWPAACPAPAAQTELRSNSSPSLRPEQLVGKQIKEFLLKNPRSNRLAVAFCQVCQRRGDLPLQWGDHLRPRTL